MTRSLPNSAPPVGRSFSESLALHSQLVDAELERLIRSEEQIENLHDGLLYSLGLDQQDAAIRGKRLRPVLCLITAETLGAGPKLALPFAAAIELFHNFALVHDDIEDGDTMRRGRPCTYMHYGLPQAINIGDYFICKVISIFAGVKSWDERTRFRLLELLSETADHTHIGQCLDMNARGSRNFTRDDYLRIVREKTGYYLAAPMLGGAVIAGADEKTMEALRHFGHVIGPLFQIVDDLIDLTEGKGRGAAGSDIREGKRSYLVAAVAPNCTVDELATLYGVLDSPRDETTVESVAWVIDLFKRRGAITEAARYCDELKAEALAALQGVPEPLRVVLTEATELLMTRKT